MIRIVLSVLLVAGCAATGVASKGAVMDIESGMARQDVTARLGPPGNRTFRGDVEALQYCRTGLMTDEYWTVWLLRGRVAALSSTNAAIAQGSCAGRFPPMDWANAPPDVRIAIERAE